MLLKYQQLYSLKDFSILFYVIRNLNQDFLRYSQEYNVPAASRLQLLFAHHCEAAVWIDSKFSFNITQSDNFYFRGFPYSLKIWPTDPVSVPKFYSVERLLFGGITVDRYKLI